MKYGTYAYNDPNAPKITAGMMFGGGSVTLPKFDYPISAVENLRRAARHDKPLWTPNAVLDFQSISPNDMIRPTEATRGQCVCMDFSHPHASDYTFTDWFLTDWTYVHSAGGPMLTPGFKLCDDVADWESAVKFPNLSDWDWDTFHSDFMKNNYDPLRALSCDIGLGCTERFVSIMGGYTDAMVAFATEPEACKAFFEAFIDHEIEQFDMMMKYYPIAMLTYHDDWGNEKDTFFSPKMLEDMLIEPTKRFIDHVKSRDVVFEFHSCGNITRFLPYFADLGVEFLQIQRRAVDFIKLKEKWGAKLGYGGGIEGLEIGGPDPAGDELIPLIHKTIDLHAPTGGFYMGVFLRDPELMWNAANEIYSYSREFYERENG
jgi:hypothetical protein